LDFWSGLDQILSCNNTEQNDVAPELYNKNIFVNQTNTYIHELHNATNNNAGRQAHKNIDD